MRVETLIKDIENKVLVLPEFQRDFVWKPNDVKSFIESMYKSYPTGSLLIWKTLTPPRLRGGQGVNDNVYTNVLVDGQQRLTSLYLFLKGDSPPYYDKKLKRLKLYFNVEREIFRYYQTFMNGKREWISLIDFYRDESAATFISGSPNKDYYFDHIEKLTRLEKIKHYDYFVDDEKLSKLSDIREVVDIFNLVNKQGRTLTEEDLALAYVCSFWPEIKVLFRKELDIMEARGFKFTFNFLILCLNAVSTGHAKFESFYRTSEEHIKESWERTKTALERILNFLHDNAYINSSDKYELKTDALLVPIVTYLANNNCIFKDDKEINTFLYWFYVAMIWGRYTRRGKRTPLEQDVVTITKENTPESLINVFQREVRYFEVKKENLEGVPVSSPFFNMAFIVSKSKGAIDWFTGNKLHVRLLGDSYNLNKHHIFPKALLKKKGYYKHIDKKKMVNELANRSFLTRRANTEIRDKEPIRYLPGVLKRYPKALRQQFVPVKNEFWKVSHFEQFLRWRRSKIAKEINKFLESLIKDSDLQLSTEELIKQDEAYNLEFKSTFSWNMRENNPDKNIKFAAQKTILAFMNSEGGTLIIGVDDDKNVIGLNFDYKASHRGNKDGFLLEFGDYMHKEMGPTNYKKYISTEIDLVEDKDVLVVKVEKSIDPVYVKKNGRKILYVRIDNKTEPLEDPEEIQRYIKYSWD